MSEKYLILILILVIFLAFYIVIKLGTLTTKGGDTPNHIKTYLKGVRILIIFLAILASILWITLR